MNIKITLNIVVYDLWFLRYRECPYSGTFPYITRLIIIFLCINNHNQV